MPREVRRESFEKWLSVNSVCFLHVTRTVQWNTSITDTFGEQCFGHYTEVTFVELS